MNKQDLRILKHLLTISKGFDVKSIKFGGFDIVFHDQKNEPKPTDVVGIPKKSVPELNAQELNRVFGSDMPPDSEMLFYSSDPIFDIKPKEGLDS